MKRRTFVKNVVPAAVLPSLINGWSFKALGSPADSLMGGAEYNTDRVLVLIDLNGGNDGLNSVIPLDQLSQLSNARSNILIPQGDILPLSGTPNTGLHPSLADLGELYNEGKLTVVQGVGYPDPDFSHFRSTDIWISASDSDEVLNTGWLGRFMDSVYPGYPDGYPTVEMPHPLAVQVASNLPLLFQAEEANVALTFTSASIFTDFTTGIDDPVAGTPAGKELAYIRQVANLTQVYSQELLTAYLNVTSQYSGYPSPGSNYLADVLKAVARLIAGGLKTPIYLVSLYGFDTHSSQTDGSVTTTGVHADLLKYLSEAIYAFQKDLEFLNVADRVLGMTFSEFGRRIASNASLGTDHGTAGPVFLFGNKVQPGVLGNNPVIPSTVTTEDNLSMQYDFRSLYASILRDWFCVDETTITNDILFGTFQYLPIVNGECTVSVLDEVNKLNEKVKISLSPNPAYSTAIISYYTLEGNTRIEIFDTNGKCVLTPVLGKHLEGDFSVSVDVSGFPAGNYYCRLQNGPLQQVKSFVVAR